MFQFLNYFTSKELAISTWVLILIAYFVLEQKEGYNALKNFVKCIFNFQFIKGFLGIFLYFAFATFLFYKCNIWNFLCLKDSIVWFILSGFSIFINYLGKSEEPPKLSTLIKENLKYTLFFEYIYNTYSLPFIIEFLSIPLFFALAGAEVAAGDNEEYKQIKMLINKFFSFVGISIFGYCLFCTIIHFKEIATPITFINIILPILYLISFLPLIFILKITSEYKFVFTILKLNELSDIKLKKYYKHKIIMHSKFNYKELRKYFHYALSQDCNFQTTKDIDDFMSLYIKRNTIQPLDNDSVGFNPLEVITYLSDENFPEGCYQYYGFDEGFGEYGAEILKSIDTDCFTYSIDGNQQLALKLELGFDEFTFEKQKNNNHKIFINYAHKLFNKCFNEPLPDNIIRALKNKQRKTFYFRDYKIIIDKIKYENNPNLKTYKFIIQTKKRSSAQNEEQVMAAS